MVKSSWACKSRYSVVKLEDMSIRVLLLVHLSSGVRVTVFFILPRQRMRSVFLYVRIDRT